MSGLKVCDSARIIGHVHLGQDVHIAQGAVLRSEMEPLKIGNGSMVLENSVLIGTSRFPLTVGKKTVLGHKCIAIGTVIGDLCEIGNGTILLPGSRVGNMCIFGEGTLILPGTRIPDGSVVVGRPGRVIRAINDADRSMIRKMRNGDLTLNEYNESILETVPGRSEGMGKLYPFGDHYPKISDSALLFDSAEITGDVTVGEHSIISSGVRIIGDSHGPVRIGRNVQILENSVLHLLPDNELIIQDDVTIGPGCIIHGAVIGKGSVIESGAIVCDHSKLGPNTLVRSGSLVKQHSIFSENSILEGFPARSVGSSPDPLLRPDWAIQSEN